MVMRTTAATASPPFAHREPAPRDAGQRPTPSTGNEQQNASRFSALSSSRWNRVLRFAAVGSITAVLQILVLVVLERHGWAALLANAVGFVLSAQVNFALNSAFTWRDRGALTPLRRRWVLFHGSIIATALLNQVVFAVAHMFAPLIVASLCGIAVASLGNFVLGDRFVFRGATVAVLSPEQAA